MRPGLRGPNAGDSLRRRWQVQTFEINAEFDPVNGGGFGELQRGTVWVQFCLFDGQENFINSYRWALAR
ncbi:MAG: hypothetical protein ACRD2W_02915 [Acidimicrobiales bacterium]